MRLLALSLGLVAVFSAGALLGSAPAASDSGQTSSCQSTATTTATTPTTTTTTDTTPTTTTPTTTNTTPTTTDTTPTTTNTTPTTTNTTPTATNTTPTTTTTTPTTTTPAPVIPRPTGDPLNNNTLENCNEGTIKARSKLQVASINDSSADPVNFAYAYAHDCASGCEAIAAAFQVALIDNHARVQTPQNVALAVNFKCNHCGVFAYAYQYAVEVPNGTRLSSATRHQIASIRRQADADVKAKLSFAALDGKLRVLAAQLRAAVDSGLQKEHASEEERHSSEHVKQSAQR